MIEPIDSLEDFRLEPYRNLRDRDLAGDPRGGRFIVESERVVRRMLATPYRLQLQSIVSTHVRAKEMAAAAPPETPIYALPDAQITQLLGYKFHSGVMACGWRPALDHDVQRFAERLPPDARLVVCPDINNTENLGLLLRLAAGFGVHAVVLGPRCCDPFYRQTIRVSMGTIFSLKLLFMRDSVRDLQWLQREAQVTLVATVLDPSAEPLPGVHVAGRVALLFGNEAQGLPLDLVGFCDRKVTIPMQFGTDSLNVATAAAIVLYHLST